MGLKSVLVLEAHVGKACLWPHAFSFAQSLFCSVEPLPLFPACQVEMSRLQRDFQTAEIMGLSLREQLAARETELKELSSKHKELQAEQAAASAALLESQASLNGLQLRHENMQASNAEQVAKLQAALQKEHVQLADVRRELGEMRAERMALERSLNESSARETAVTAQLKQLASAHEQQTSKLRQETETRRNADDELQALRAGLQVGAGGWAQVSGRCRKFTSRAPATSCKWFRPAGHSRQGQGQFAIWCARSKIRASHSQDVLLPVSEFVCLPGWHAGDPAAP